MKKSLFCLLYLLFASVVSAQTNQDACVPSPGPFTVTSGRPFTVLWTVPPTEPRAVDDPTPVPTRWDGFYIQIDSDPRQSVTVLAGSACPAGTPLAGHIPFLYRNEFGATRGQHWLRVTLWRFKKDENGNTTTERAESDALTIPFSAADVFLDPKPPAPSGVKIVR
jgi:hypothetical protein